MIEITKYSTPGCVNCKILGMKLKPIVEAHRGSCTFVDVDVTTQGNPLNITSVPWLVIKKDGEEIFNDHVVNVMDMVKRIQTLL